MVCRLNSGSHRQPIIKGSSKCRPLGLGNQRFDGGGNTFEVARRSCRALHANLIGSHTLAQQSSHKCPLSQMVGNELGAELFFPVLQLLNVFPSADKNRFAGFGVISHTRNTANQHCDLGFECFTTKPFVVLRTASRREEYDLDELI